MNIFFKMKSWRQVRQFSIVFVLALLFALPVLAAETVKKDEGEKYRLLVRIGSTTEVPIADGICQWILALYTYLIGASGVVAAFFITLGGFRYVISGGNSEQTGQAKENITNGVVGMMLVLSAYVLLNTINPALITCRLPAIRKIENIPMPSGMCPNKVTYECGKEYNKGDDIPAGTSCIGQWCGGIDDIKCISYRSHGLKGGREIVLTEYECVKKDDCNGKDTCQEISATKIGAAWSGVCETNFCPMKNNLKCYVQWVGNDPARATAGNCLPQEDLGSECNDDKNIYCRQPYVCKDNRCAPAGTVKNIMAGANCSEDAQCADGICNKARNSYGTMTAAGMPAPEGVGACVPKKGYQKKDMPCETGARGITICGNDFRCIPINPDKPEWGVCSDRKVNQKCDPNGSQPCFYTEKTECKLQQNEYRCLRKPLSLGEDCAQAGECESKKCCNVKNNCVQGETADKVVDGKCVEAAPDTSPAEAAPPPTTP